MLLVGNPARDREKLDHTLCPHILMELTANWSSQVLRPTGPPSAVVRMCYQRSSRRWRPQITH